MGKIRLLIIILVVTIMPYCVNAKELCKVVSGDGKSIGSEIACGNEHFNVISSNNNEIRMLSKYNLNVGNSIFKEKINKEAESTETDQNYCARIATEQGGYLRYDEFYNIDGYCYIEKPLNYTIEQWESNYSVDGLTTIETCEAHADELNTTDENYYYIFDHDQTVTTPLPPYYIPHCYYKKIPRGLVQDESAKSAHWNENDEFLYPQIGDIYINGIYERYAEDYFKADLTCDNNSSDKYDGYFWDLTITEKGQFDTILKSYAVTMAPYNARKIDLITLEDINNIITNNNKSLSYQNIYNASLNTQPPRYEFAFLQDYLTKQQEFLFNTTYWVRTGYNKDYDDALAVGNVVFIDARGGICGSAMSRGGEQRIYGNCSYKIERKLKSSVGTGIRPVVTISPEDIEYIIKTITDGNGTIEVIKNAHGGDTITFKTTAKPGYKLTKLIVTTDSGEKVEFKEGQIINNDDSTVSIDKNSFTMPFENVTIEARWSLNILNPETGNKILFIIIFIVVISSLLSFKKVKQNNKYIKN